LKKGWIDELDGRGRRGRLPVVGGSIVVLRMRDIVIWVVLRRLLYLLRLLDRLLNRLLDRLLKLLMGLVMVLLRVALW